MKNKALNNTTMNKTLLSYFSRNALATMLGN